jgi:hypothetical protein
MTVEVGSIPGLMRALKNKAPEIKVTHFDLATKVMRFKKIQKLSRKEIAVAMTGMGNDMFAILPLLAIDRDLLFALHNDYEMEIDTNDDIGNGGLTRTGQIILKRKASKEN